MGYLYLLRVRVGSGRDPPRGSVLSDARKSEAGNYGDVVRVSVEEIAAHTHAVKPSITAVLTTGSPS